MTHNVMTQNVLIYYSIILISCLIVFKLLKKKIHLKVLIFVICYIILFLIIEVIDIFTPFPIWDQTERTSNCYDWFQYYFKRNYDKEYIEEVKQWDVQLNDG